MWVWRGVTRGVGRCGCGEGWVRWGVRRDVGCGVGCADVCALGYSEMQYNTLSNAVLSFFRMLFGDFDYTHFLRSENAGTFWFVLSKLVQPQHAAACRSMPQHLFFGAAHGGFEACRSMPQHAAACRSTRNFSEGPH